MVCYVAVSKYLLELVFKLKIFYSFILAALGLCCCTRAISWLLQAGATLLVVHRLLIAMASLAVE